MLRTSLSILLLTATAGVVESKSKGGKMITVPLQKQMVPVKRDNETVSYKTAYFGTIQLGGGKHKQDLSVTFDTSSGQVIVPSSRCKSTACLLHRSYNISKSSTGADINADGSRVKADEERDEVTVGFGTGEVSGDFAKEIVCMGGEDASGATTSLCVDKVGLIMGVEMSDEPFQSFAFDGVLGLGLPALSLGPQFSFFGTMLMKKQIAAPQFALYLGGSDNSASEITFGGYNVARTRTQPAWLSVASPELGYWQLDIKDIRVDGRVIDFCRKQKCGAMIDSGSSHLGVPGEAYSELRDLLSQIQSTNDTRSIDCRKARGPQMEINFGHFSIKLGSKDYARPRPFLGKTQVTCKPNLMRVSMPPPLGPNLFVLGEPVLRRYYTVFDWAKQAVGFAEPKQDFEDEIVLLQIHATVIHHRI